MEYNGSKEFVRCERRAEIYADTGTDYSLPDYNGDVRRVLFTNAEVHPSGSFENGESVDFSGIVVYDMVYADSDNRINCASFSSDYDFTVKCTEEGFLSADADSSLANFSLRLLGPRKISARATVVSDVTLSNSNTSAPAGDVFEGGGMPEVDTDRVEMYYSKRSGGVEREYAEAVCRLDGAVLDEVSVVYSNAECVIDGVQPDNGSVAMKGNMRVYAVVRNGDDAMFVAEKSVRIDESVPFEGLCGELKLLPVVRVGSVRPAVNADENGCTVTVSVIVELMAEGIGNRSVEVVTDAYLKDGECENSYGDFNYGQLLSLTAEKSEIGGSVERDSLEVENLREVMCLHAEPRIESCRYEDGVARIVGEMVYAGISSASDSNGAVSYYPFKTSVEFVENVNINCRDDENLNVIPKIECYSANAIVDEKQVSLSTSVSVKIFAVTDKSVRILTDSKLAEGAEVEDRGTKITVYYPERGERIFDIAKKFHTTVEKITSDNSGAVRAMSDGSEEGVARLLIY